LSITIQHTQEILCLAHIHAVAGMAGVNLELGRVHDYGVDGSFKPVTIRGNRRVESGFAIDFQAKSTYDWELADGCIVYDFEVKNYNDIVSRSEAETKLILILLCLPPEQDEWHDASIVTTIMRHCCYWTELTGELTDNVGTKRVFIPQSKILTAQSLSDLLAQERMRRRSFFS
jgi:hypothetical protein